MTQESQRKPYDWQDAQIGTELGTFEYVLTQAQVDNYRKAVDDPEAPFTTLAVKHDVAAFGLVYEGTSGVNARNEVQFFHPPIPGKKIKVTGRIVDKYVRRDLPYLVIEATATDEDGRLIEKIRTYSMQRTQKIGEKWQQLQR
jgi:hypothetical protein